MRRGGHGDAGPKPYGHRRSHLDDTGDARRPEPQGTGCVGNPHVGVGGQFHRYPAAATPAPTATVAATTTPGTPVSPPAEPTPTRPPPPTPVPSPTPEPTPNPTAAPTHAPARLPGTPDVEITGGFAFSPNDVTVRVGDTVVWTVTGIGHTTTSGTPTEPSGTWDSGFLRVGESFSQTLTAPGELLYFCNIHKSMRGKVTVTE